MDGAPRKRSNSKLTAATNPFLTKNTPRIYHMSNNDNLVLHHYAENVYLEYAIATVKGRALAQVQDGLKPVQRRILHAMRALGLSSSAKPVKSARVVGDVLGKYHPHGDQAAYEAMVRMAQDFSLRYPLIVGQGNFGSRDGDSAAAMRYTEAKLSPISELLLQELGQGTVSFSANYDGTLTEPDLLPARLPMLLLNGTMGIAVGMAADIPPHNLREVASAAVALIKNPELSATELMEHLPGPDFPGGAQITATPAEIESVYRTGRGSIRCRASWNKEDLARGQWQIVVTELPYQISTRTILEELDALTNPQPPAGKKSLTQQQLQSKQLALDFLEKAVDESDKSNAVRIVLVPRTSKVDAEQMMAFLARSTSLECNISVNMTLIGLDGRPQTKTLKDVLSEWVAFRTETVERRTLWELAGAEKRKHILEGRLIVFDALDKVVAIIRTSDDPKPELMAKFALSDVQAEDVLEMRLRQLNRLEGKKIETEIKELTALCERLRQLLGDPQALAALVITEIQADAAKYGDDRRSLLNPQQKAANVKPGPTVLDEPLTIVVSKNLWIRGYKGHDLNPDAFQFKPGDSLAHKVETRSTQQVFLLDTMGRAYCIDAHVAPMARGEGAPLSTLVEMQPGATLHAMLAGAPDDLYLFGGQKGYGFFAPLKSLSTRQKAGKTFLSLEEGEKPLAPNCLPRGKQLLAVQSTQGRLLIFDHKEVKTLVSGGKGVQLISLPEEALIERIDWACGAGMTMELPGKGKKAGKTVCVQGDEWLKWVARRARKGAEVPEGASYHFNEEASEAP